MTIQNMLIPLVEVLSLTEKIAEDNKAAWVTLTGRQTPAPLYGAVHLQQHCDEYINYCKYCC